MNYSDYWEETVREAASEAGVELTSDQVGIIAGAVEVSHENFGLYTGHDVASSNWHDVQSRKLDDLQREHQRELDAVVARHHRKIQDCEWTERKLRRRLREEQEKSEALT
jgi:hypothetical protein